ncbi:MAG: hypothetical protein HOM02_05995, partial [Thaumarchaeota archaeon]|nr:hypothetical protein [Nitrososphaerota archaeon]
MNKSLRYIALLAILPLFTAGMTTDYFSDAEALKSQGTGTSQYGSSTGICGLDLCSNYPGGKAAWESDLGRTSIPVAPVEKHMEEKHMEEKHMGETMEDSEDLTEADLGSVLRLSRANVPATIPMHQGYYDGEDVYYIITDSSDPKHAEIITENQGWQVELAPLLKNTPDVALSKTFMFTNGVEGDGIHGYQGEVFTSTPAQADVYSALTSHVHVTWNDGTTPRVFTSETAVMDAAENNEITLTEVDVVLNMPQIIWPEGQMMVKDVTLTDTTPYGGGQILDINTEEMNVTFIAHRGWGPDGRTIYYIVTDAT